MRNTKCLVWSAVSALAFLMVSYWITNLRFPVSGEKTVLSKLELLRSMLFYKEQTVPDSILFINVTYDKVSVPVIDEYGFPAGQTQITDRHKLLELLTFLKQDGSYKYILLDVFFGKEGTTEWDDSLFATIASMPRITVPCHSDEPIADQRLQAKAGLADYITTFSVPDFTKFPYLTDSQKSLPVKMYEELTGHEIRREGLLYTDGLMLARSSIVLTFDLKADAMYADDGEKIWYNLGMDLLADSLPGTEERGNNLLYESPGLTKNKYIVVGALNGDDTHATFAGQMSGAVVNFNAFISLLNRHHIVSVTLLCILFVTFFFLSYLALSRKHLQDLLEGWTTTTKNKWQHRGLKALKMLSSWVGLSLFLTLLCIITYLLLGEAYDIFITSTLFYLLQKAVCLYDKIRGKKQS